MTTGSANSNFPVSRLSNVSLRYGKTLALHGVNLDFPSGLMVGLIGPDGVGKSSLMALVAGARAVQQGKVETLGGDMSSARHRNQVCLRIAYMPQGLGKNLYPTLSIEENLQFFGRLFGQPAVKRRRRIDELTSATSLHAFLNRPVGKLSGGMKQKLGLCCALIHDPDLLILDEPTTGVDPLARHQFWRLIAKIRQDNPGMSVIVATAYMEEADQFDWLVAMDAGRILATGTPQDLRKSTGTDSLEATFIALLPEAKRRGHRAPVVPPLVGDGDREIAIEARDLTMKFGDFTAVDHVSFRIRQGEIFGFLGPNGCGKTTTMKMLTGLLPPTEGQAWLFGHEVEANDIATRRRVGYMSQSFSLYTELTVKQNLVLHARIFQVPETEIPGRIQEMAERFGIDHVFDELPDNLPLGIRQRLSLAVAMVHRPELLILDEPTSGVDPIARDNFWQLMVDLSRKDKVTIFISTHFMNEAARCDRISLMQAGKVLVSDAPAQIVRKRSAATLEEAFIRYLEDANARDEEIQHPKSILVTQPIAKTNTDSVPHKPRKFFDVSRAFSYAMRETLELRRDPIRLTLALLGSVVLMIIMGYGITLDVEHLTFAVLDRDHTGMSRDYVYNLAGSERYFTERSPIADYDELDRRMKSGEISMALEIPPNFGRKVERGTPVQIGVWIDGAMPQRAETIRGYLQGMHATWLADIARRRLGQQLASPATIELRYRYNPDVKSLVGMVPGVMTIMLLWIPAMLSALAVVREKDLGSIINFYVTPTTRLEFLLGKQIPYVALGMISFLLLMLLAVTLFGVPLKGSFAAEATGALLYVGCATGIGLLISTLMRSQLAAIIFAVVLTLVPAKEYCGLVDPVSSLQGTGALIGRIYPTTYYITISQGTFSKALGFAELWGAFIPMLIAIPVLFGLSMALLKKQEA